MSPDLDLVRSIYTDWERADYRRVDWADPEIEYSIVGGPSPGHWTGVSGMAEGWRDALNAWTEFHGEAEDYRELDEERVLVLARISARGRASGVELPEAWTRHAALFQIQDGKVTKLVVYSDRNRAYADLGLTPEGDPR
jgi:ketosteroid isomerase-like protein